jgi:hypothetical protein
LLLLALLAEQAEAAYKHRQQMECSIGTLCCKPHACATHHFKTSRLNNAATAADALLLPHTHAEMHSDSGYAATCF